MNNLIVFHAAKLLVERLKRSKHIQLQSKVSIENIIAASPGNIMQNLSLQCVNLKLNFSSV